MRRTTKAKVTTAQIVAAYERLQSYRAVATELGISKAGAAYHIRTHRREQAFCALTLEQAEALDLDAWLLLPASVQERIVAAYCRA